MAIVLKADRIFTGHEWLQDHAIVIKDDKVEAVLPGTALASDLEIKNFGNNIIAPGLIDLQIYGATGALLSMKPTAHTVELIYNYSKEGGACLCQPTVATNTKEVIFNCIDAISDYRKNNGKGVIGLHIEGPWINKAKRGAHIEAFIHSPSIEEVTELLEYGKGVITMITIAPEVCSPGIIRLIQSYGVVVSAGHSNATYKEATTAFDTDITVATHLYNAMSPLQHRAPGIVGAIFHHSSVMCSLVADGYHVDFAAISIAKKIMGERLFLITDAVSETIEGPYPHQLAGEKYEANGILSGSALTMAKAVKNCVEKAGIELGEALRMASLYPAKVMGLAHERGKIAKEYKAEFVVLNEELQVVGQTF